MGAPTLGYGNQGEVSLDTYNQWQRAQPWYQDLIRSFGQDPSSVKLNDAQKLAVVRAAQAHGVVVDEGGGGQEVDDSGNFRGVGHKLRNGLIVAGIAGAALLTAGAAGAFAGGAAPAAAGGGTLAATATVPATGALATGLASGTAAAGGAATAAGGASVIPWGTIVNAGSSLFGNLFAAHATSSAADQAAADTAAAAKYSADLTAKANADALKFEYASGENAFQNSEAARQGNYGIFAARERRLGTIGEEVGLGPREIPAYVPGVDPKFGDAAGSPASPGATPTGSSDSDIMAALTQNYQALGVSPTGPGSGPTDIAYMAGKIKETGGLTPGNASYWLGPNGRVAQELAKAKGGAVTAQPVARTAAAPGTTATPFMPATIAAAPQAFGYYA